MAAHFNGAGLFACASPHTEYLSINLRIIKPLKLQTFKHRPLHCNIQYFMYINGQYSPSLAISGDAFCNFPRITHPLLKPKYSILLAMKGR